MRPDAANPTAVEPNALIAINELAAASSSSVATSGSTLECAGSKKVETELESITMTYSQTILWGTRKGIEKTSAARSKSDAQVVQDAENGHEETPESELVIADHTNSPLIG